MVRVIVAEKPSQARAIADAIGVRGRGDGHIDGGNVVISWCIGHLVELAPPESYDETLAKWTLDSLPFLPQQFKHIPSKSTIDQFKILKSLLLRQDVDEVVCATDSGREGELIFDLVYRASGCRKPVKRLWTASLTPEAIREAYHSLRPAAEFAGLRAAAHCRAQADWLVGLNATRAQTLKAQAAGGSGVWAVGRVQTPTLAMLVSRETAIRKFVSRAFWQVDAHFQAKSGAYSGRWFSEVDGKAISQIDQKSSADAILARIRGNRGAVESVVGVNQVRRPEQFFDLTALQREANKRFGFSADMTLQLAQALYERGILSYPRTNSKYITESEAKRLPNVLCSLSERYLEFVKQTKGRELGKRFVDASKVEDHHAILPTGKTGSMNAEEIKIFDLVCRRTIAAYFDDELSKKTTVITVIGQDRFRSIGRVVLSPGWTVVDSEMSVDRGENAADEEKSILPPLEKGESVGLEKALAKEGKTQPPKPYTEGDLLGAMETAGKTLTDEHMREAMRDSGLGTPATRAAIIEGLLARELSTRKGKAIIASEKGMRLIESLNSDALKSPELTGDWESRLEKVRRGQLSPETFMQSVREYTKQIISQIKSQHLEAIIGEKTTSSPSINPCPQCKSPMQIRNWQGKYYAKCSAKNGKDCNVSYDCDANGKPKGGVCKKCKQPLKITKSGAKVCIGCGTWVENTNGGKRGEGKDYSRQKSARIPAQKD